MPLPGGVLHGGERRRDFAFRPLTGAVELAVAESARMERSMPTVVTEVLAATLDHIGGENPSPETIAGLSVADRQYLMRQLTVLLGQGENWLTYDCGSCGERFDFSVSNADLPVKEARDGYPFALAETSLGLCRFRVPNGADQQAIARVGDDADAVRLLVMRCFMGFVHGGDHELALQNFTAEDLLRIESAIEATAAEVGTMVQAVCPECGAPHLLEIDPYAALKGQSLDALLQEVHTIASAYHWSEAEILALPLARRRRYLALIDRARGMVS